jgi:hypothetical protein
MRDSEIFQMVMYPVAIATLFYLVFKVIEAAP